jgi:ATP-dependent Clp protease ATP-binding subunit ClpC
MLAKALGKGFFGNDDSIIRLDMSEYLERHSIAKLIGSPPGYVGFEEGGMLVEKLRRHPYSVLLLDEIEKAHPDIFNILLQMLEEGRLTDSCGRTADLSNVIIIMTTNLGAKAAAEKKPLGFSGEERLAQAEKAELMAAVKGFMSPELLGRLDEVIFFSPLDKNDLCKIAARELGTLKERLKGLGYTLDVSDTCAQLAAEKALENNGSAREVRRIVSSQIENLICDTMLESTSREIRLDTSQGAFIIKQAVKNPS